MAEDRHAAEIREFQESGDPAAILRYCRRRDEKSEEFQQVIDGLAPVFQALNLGIEPAYADVDRQALTRLREETETLAGWMVESRRADLKTAGVRVMGELAWEGFVPILRRLRQSDEEWVREEAGRALGQATDSDPRPP